MKTLIQLILDRSGSMGGLESDVVGGVNKFIDEQKTLKDDSVIAMARFDDVYELFRPVQPLQEAQHITRDDYVPRGLTALLDAIGKTLTDLDAVWAKENPDKAIVLIATDGHENNSKEFSRAKIKEMIESREKSGKWVFIYIGADVGAFSEAASIGVRAANTANYVNTSKGVHTMYARAALSTVSMRSGATLDANFGGAIPEEEEVAPASGDATVSWTQPSQ